MPTKINSQNFVIKFCECCVHSKIHQVVICSFHDPGDTEPDPDDFAGELSAELDVDEAGGAAVQDKRCGEGGRGAAASRQEGHTSTQDEVQCSMSYLRLIPRPYSHHFMCAGI